MSVTIMIIVQMISVIASAIKTDCNRNNRFDSTWNFSEAQLDVSTKLQENDDILKDLFGNATDAFYNANLNIWPISEQMTMYPAELRELHRIIRGNLGQYPIKDNGNLFGDKIFNTIFNPENGFIHNLEMKKSLTAPAETPCDLIKSQMLIHYGVLLNIMNRGYLPLDKDGKDISIVGLYERLATIGILYRFEWKSVGTRVNQCLNEILGFAKEAAIRMSSGHVQEEGSTGKSEFVRGSELKFDIYSLRKITDLCLGMQREIMLMPYKLIKTKPLTSDTSSSLNVSGLNASDTSLLIPFKKADMIFKSLDNALMGACESLYYCFKAILDGDSLQDSGKKSFINVCASANAFKSMVRFIIISLLKYDDIRVEQLKNETLDIENVTTEMPNTYNQTQNYEGLWDTRAEHSQMDKMLDRFGPISAPLNITDINVEDTVFGTDLPLFFSEKHQYANATPTSSRRFELSGTTDPNIPSSFTPATSNIYTSQKPLYEDLISSLRNNRVIELIAPNERYERFVLPSDTSSLSLDSSGNEQTPRPSTVLTNIKTFIEGSNAPLSNVSTTERSEIPKESPVIPKESPVVPKESPVVPKESPVVPTITIDEPSVTTSAHDIPLGDVSEEYPFLPQHQVKTLSIPFTPVKEDDKIVGDVTRHMASSWNQSASDASPSETSDSRINVTPPTQKRSPYDLRPRQAALRLNSQSKPTASKLESSSPTQTSFESNPSEKSRHKKHGGKDFSNKAKKEHREKEQEKAKTASPQAASNKKPQGKRSHDSDSPPSGGRRNKAQKRK